MHVKWYQSEHDMGPYIQYTTEDYKDIESLELKIMHALTLIEMTGSCEPGPATRSESPGETKYSDKHFVFIIRLYFERSSFKLKKTLVYLLRQVTNLHYLISFCSLA